MPGVKLVGQGERDGVSHNLPVGIVNDVAHFRALVIHHQAGGTEVVAQDVV